MTSDSDWGINWFIELKGYEHVFFEIFLKLNQLNSNRYKKFFGGFWKNF